MKPGHVIAGKYRLERVAGRGGMGLVWRATHVELGIPLAVKVLAAGAEGDPRAQRRFKQEARAAAALRCHHVVDVRDYGVDAGSPYLVMELLDGESVGQRLSRAPGLLLSELSSLVAQAAIALDYAHARGFLHRDVKPSNLFLARVDNSTVLKVLDFGIVKSVREAYRDTNTMVGSPGYLSPEQARGEALDHTTDLWSLGAVIYRAATGVEPFAAESLAEIVERVCQLPIAAPTALRPELPSTLDAFFERALCRDPARRFRSGAELAAAFDAIAREAPALVLPSPMTERLQGSPPRFDSTQSWAPFSSRTLPTAPGASKRRTRPWRYAAFGVAAALLGLALGAGASLRSWLAPEPSTRAGASTAVLGPATPVAAAEQAPAAALVAEPPLAPTAATRAVPPAPEPASAPKSRSEQAQLRPLASTVITRQQKPASVATAPAASGAPVPPPRTLDPTFGLPLEHSEANHASADFSRSRVVDAD
jgi:serine/threonine-protein kinase